MRISEFDVVFLSYDEPNADLHYADLCNKVPWAKRIHGVKGSDAAHKAAANASETDWLVTVDADNIVDTRFFDFDVDFSNPDIEVFSWCALNTVNGLRYGNGGLKLWKKSFILDMKTHEDAKDRRAQVDFCWENKYRQFPQTFSDIVITGSAFQAWRAGFREGVKMTLLDGIKVQPHEIKQRVWWHNLHRLKMWACVGSHVDLGKFAMLGARQGCYMANCTDWDYIQVRDFEVLNQIYKDTVQSLENNEDALDQAIVSYGKKVNLSLGFNWPVLDADHSRFAAEIYNESLSMNDTYFRALKNV